jgi:23S rRNA pseudouridine1911/1915/1917 synthase
MVDIPFEVLWHEQGVRADVFLSRRIVRMSRSLAAKLILTGCVRRDPPSSLLKPSSKLQHGDRLILKRKKLDEAPTDDIEVPVVFQDERILAVSKPGNLVVHPTASAYQRTLIRILRARLGDERLDLAHRIDKETSGLVLLARDMEAAADLKGQFADRKVQKSYLAIVEGVPAQDELVIDAPLRLVVDSESSVIMEVGGANDLPAFTEVTVLARGRSAALVEARPKTGRQHQIRVHLLSKGHPILGDKLYRGSEQFFIEALRGEVSEEAIVERVGHHRQALHAYSATFRHPGTQEMMTLSAPMPEDMIELAKRNGIAIDRSEL